MEVSKHGGVGNKNKQKTLKDAYVSARNKIMWVIKNIACQFAMRIIQNVAGMQHHRYGLFEGGVQPVYLPPNTSLCVIWLEWVPVIGWDPIKTFKHRQMFEKKDHWVHSDGLFETEEEAAQNEGGVAKTILTYT